MRFFLISNHFKQCFVEFVIITWKLEVSLFLSDTLNTTPCIFHWNSVAFLFLLSVYRNNEQIYLHFVKEIRTGERDEPKDKIEQIIPLAGTM